MRLWDCRCCRQWVPRRCGGWSSYNGVAEWCCGPVPTTPCGPCCRTGTRHCGPASGSLAVLARCRTRRYVAGHWYWQIQDPLHFTRLPMSAAGPVLAAVVATPSKQVLDPHLQSELGAWTALAQRLNVCFWRATSLPPWPLSCPGRSGHVPTCILPVLLSTQPRTHAGVRKPT